MTSKKDMAYKHGHWRMDAAEKTPLDKNSLMLSIIERLKKDIENFDPKDKRAQKLINDLLYHYCWKMISNERN